MAGRARGAVGPPRKRDAVADLVREMIADGTLRPGGAAPSGRFLADKTGYSAITCRAALRLLVADKTLVPGVSPNARPRVPRRGGRGGRRVADQLGAGLSKALAGRRHAAGMTQPEAADRLGVSLTTVGHAETGRLWQSRDFWVRASGLLGCGGDLLRMYDQYAAARFAAHEEDDNAAAADEPEQAAPVVAAAALPLSVAITAAGVVATWPDGSQTVARPPGSGLDRLDPLA